jgi:hypothetical protein
MTRTETLKTAKPILFSTPMVQALLAGNKTQTRRVIKPQPVGVPRYAELRRHWYDDNPENSLAAFNDVTPMSRQPYRSRDILYVRETWQRRKCDSDNDDIVCPAGDNYLCALSGVGCIFNGKKYLYRADPETNNYDFDEFLWRPSIFMPKSAARLFLRVKEVRAERVQEITDLDCIAEGIVPILPEPIEETYKRLKPSYAKLWDSLNAKSGYSWESNPWVWVYTFERVTPEEE